MTGNDRESASSGLAGRDPDPVRVTVSVLTYNAEDRVCDCLDAVLNQSRPADEVMVVDNASTDATVEIVRDRYPGVKVRVAGENTGCSGGRNRQIRWASHPYVMIVDDDAMLEERCLEHLEAAIRTSPAAGIWSPRICYDQDRNRIQFDGGWMHFIGEAVLVNPEREIEPVEREGGSEARPRQVTDRRAGEAAPLPKKPFMTVFQGGVSFLVAKEAAELVGGYDERFFFGRTDGEFSYRLTLSGFTLLTVPEAVAYHRMRERGMDQVERQIRNRWSMILQTYSWRTILVLIPAFVAYEFSVAAFLTVKGGAGRYIRGNLGLLQALPHIFSRRKDVQRLRKRRDRDVLTSGFINMRADLADKKVVRWCHSGFNRFFEAYWRLCRRLAG